MSLLTYSSLMIRYWVPPIRVHCWGGLGSQLFGWSLYEDLQIRYPSRRIHVYLHQGGVTQRPSEIDHVFEKGIIFKVFDYDPEFQINNNEVSQNFSKKTLFMFKEVTLKFLKFIGVLATVNNDLEFAKLKPWIIEIRGHYSYRAISKQSINAIADKSNSSKTPLVTVVPKQESKIGVHFRLGDLIQLKNKQPINTSQLSKIIASQALSNQIQNIEVYSDSLNEAKSYLTNELIVSNIKFYSETTWSTILRLQELEIFIGTASKVSFWVCIFRHFKDLQSNSLMPKQCERNLSLLIPNNKIVYY